jgi:acyl carrier protein
VSTDRTAERIKQLMVENLTYSGSWSEVDEDYPLLAKHVIDSLGMLKLVSLIEAEFDVEIDDDDVVPANWKTIRDIAALVASKRSPTE